MKTFVIMVASVSVIFPSIIVWAFTACLDKQDARLKTLEAAITPITAPQQPQEHYLFVVCDSAVVAGKVSK